MQRRIVCAQIKVLTSIAERRKTVRVRYSQIGERGFAHEKSEGAGEKSIAEEASEYSEAGAEENRRIGKDAKIPSPVPLFCRQERSVPERHSVQLRY